MGKAKAKRKRHRWRNNSSGWKATCGDCHDRKVNVPGKLGGTTLLYIHRNGDELRNPRAIPPCKGAQS